jgi:hypothetical protein
MWFAGSTRLCAHGLQSQAEWANGAIGTLYRLVTKAMPENAAGRLPKADYAAVIAFMLRESGYAPGASEFPSAGVP